MTRGIRSYSSGGRRTSSIRFGLPTVRPSGIFDNKSPKRGRKTKDTWTGTEYDSRNQCYQALAAGEGMDPTKKLGWYDLCARYPMRFEDVATGKRIDGHGRLVG